MGSIIVPAESQSEVLKGTLSIYVSLSIRHQIEQPDMNNDPYSLADQPVSQSAISLLEGLATTRAIRRYTN